MNPPYKVHRSLGIAPLPVDLSLAVESFLFDRRAQGLTGNTLRTYEDKLPRSLTYLSQQHKVTRLDQIQPSHIRDFLIYLQDTGHTPGGQHAYYRALKTFFRWVQAEGELDTNPMARVKPPRVPISPLDPAPLDSIRAMLDQCDRRSLLGSRDHALLLSLLDTGLRSSEIVALKPSDLSLKDGSLLVRKSKNGRPRMAFLGHKACRSLSRYLRLRGETAEDAPLFAKTTGEPLSYGGLRAIVARRAKQAGVQPPSLHSFRRCFGIECLRNGSDLLSVARLLGHTSLATVRLYLQQTSGDLREVHERTSPADRLP